MPKELQTIKTYMVYTLKEMLEDPDKRKALLDRHRLTGDDSDWHLLEMYLREDVEDALGRIHNLGFDADVKDVCYDLSCCQGSGACFDFENLDLNKLLEAEDTENSKIEGLRNLLHDNFQGSFEYFLENKQMPKIHSTRNSYASHYTHSRTRDVNWEEFDTDSPIAEDLIETKEFSSIWEQAIDQIEEIYREECSILYNYLSKRYNHYSSDEFALEDVNSEYSENALFLENGVFFEPGVNEELVQDKPFVVIDTDGKLLSRDPDLETVRFLDTVDLPDEGYHKAVKFPTKEAAYKFIAKEHSVEIHRVDHVFKESILKGE